MLRPSVRRSHPEVGALSELQCSGHRAEVQIRKSSFLALLPFVAATIQSGMRPRPVQVLSGFLGSRYLTDTTLAFAALAEHLIKREAMVFGHIGHFLPECRTLGALLFDHETVNPGAQRRQPL